MNKQNLIDMVVFKTDLDKGQAAAAVDAVISSIVDSMKAGQEVRLFGFGIFSAVQREARQARNPRTGEIFETPVSIQPKFKPSKVLKNALN